MKPSLGWVALRALPAVLFLACPGPANNNMDGGTGGGMGGGMGGSGGSNGISVSVIPQSITVPRGGSVDIVASVNGATNQTVLATLSNGGGNVTSTSINTARYVAPYQEGSAIITVTSAADANAKATISVTIANVSPISIYPNLVSNSVYTVSQGGRQTFSVAEYVSGAGVLGFENIQWRIWPVGTISADGTAAFGDARAGPTYVFANEPVSNRWDSVQLQVSTGPTLTVEVSPAVSTVAPNGVVQLTATTSNGTAVSWSTGSTNGGSINASGTYTAPALPGIYTVVAASFQDNRRFALATVIVK